MILKCASWNINGIIQRVGNTRLNKLELDECKKLLIRYHIFGVLETHSCSEDSMVFDGYKSFHKYRKKSKGARKNFGGLSVYIKESIVSGVRWLNTPSSEYTWVKLEKQYFGLVEDIYIAFVYLNPSTSSYQSNEDVLHLVSLDIAKYSKDGKCILLGDLNGRTGTGKDFAECESHIQIHDRTPVPEDYEYNTESLPLRRNQDVELPDGRGKDILDLCISTGLRILNGRMIGDWYGRFTCYAAHASKPSTIDYCLVHKHLLSEILYFSVEPLTHLSDHCIINIGMNVNFLIRPIRNHTTPPVSLNQAADKLIWDKQCVPKYQEEINSDVVYDKLTAIGNCQNIEVALSDFNEILWQSAVKANMSVKKAQTHKRKKIFPRYVTPSCYTLLKQIKRLFRKISE